MWMYVHPALILQVKRRLANLWRQVKSEEKVKDSDTPAPTSELFSPLQGNLFAIMNSYKVNKPDNSLCVCCIQVSYQV